MISRHYKFHARLSGKSSEELAGRETSTTNKVVDHCLILGDYQTLIGYTITNDIVTEIICCFK